MAHLRSLAPAVVLVASLGMAGVEAVPAAAQTLNYSSCTKLHKDFKHGVSKSKQAAKKQVNQGYGWPAYGAHAKDVYWANHKNLDRDDDGTACEA